MLLNMSMKKKMSLFTNVRKKRWFLLTLFYLCSQGFLLVATGRWWDDWGMVDQPLEVLELFGMQMGRPSVILIFSITKLLPEPIYRIVTFFMFYCCTLFFYRILKEWLVLSDTTCFWICALYTTIPAFDARIMLCIFPYTVSLFCFMAGMCHLSIALNKGSVTWKSRLLCYLFFAIAFTTNSLLVFYALVLLMIVTIKWKSIKELVHYVDFLILPLLFFEIKSVFFQPYGLYANYNEITASKLYVALRSILRADYEIICSVLSSCYKEGIAENVQIAILPILFSFFLVENRKQICHAIISKFEEKEYLQTEVKEREVGENILILLAGILTLSVGLFAYLVVRGGAFISTSGYMGRDSLLIPFGAAMIIYSFVSLVFKDKLKKYLLASVMIGGIVFFQTYYLSYQTDYYRQLGFQYQLTMHDELRNAKNIVYLNDDDGYINFQSFYVLNGNSELALGTDDKLIMGGFFGADSLLHNEALDKIVASGNYHMDSYDVSHKQIDAVVDYSFHAGLRETLKLKSLEMLNSSEFENKLHSDTEMYVYLYGTDEYDEILEENGYVNIKA